MTTYARYPDGFEVSSEVFEVLAKFAPGGTLDVFASDQHGSYQKLTSAFLKHIGEDREGTDEDIREVCIRFARSLGGASTAGLFNYLVYKEPGFRETLGEKVMLIGRLEESASTPVDGGKGQLTETAVPPEEAAEYMDGFKTLVKLNPDHKDSWERNRDWLADIHERSLKVGKPLFNETILIPNPGESKAQLARKLPDGVVKMAEDFGKYGHFYKTQVPVLWAEENGGVSRISSPKTIRQAAEEMARIVPRPMLLLSAAVDFEQYAAQYGIVADLVAGPMCGRAYFKETFTDPATTDWDSFEASFKRIALPRIAQIKVLAEKVSPPWWHKFDYISDEAKILIKIDEDKVGDRPSSRTADADTSPDRY